MERQERERSSRTNAVSSWGLEMSGAFTADLGALAVVEVAVERLDCAV